MFSSYACVTCKYTHRKPKSLNQPEYRWLGTQSTPTTGTQPLPIHTTHYRKRRGVLHICLVNYTPSRIRENGALMVGSVGIKQAHAEGCAPCKSLCSAWFIHSKRASFAMRKGDAEHLGGFGSRARAHPLFALCVFHRVCQLIGAASREVWLLYFHVGLLRPLMLSFLLHTAACYFAALYAGLEPSGSTEISESTGCRMCWGCGSRMLKWGQANERCHIQFARLANYIWMVGDGGPVPLMTSKTNCLLALAEKSSSK